ncbi:hypothetical protein GCM10023213_43180 [Prosthecobacter algae]|uniref:Uncharacterized protein n=1 Tax=Prosthecobacter algae TaxID=1144682 RepID=A0ABP9PK72_9BACT
MNCPLVLVEDRAFGLVRGTLGAELKLGGGREDIAEAAGEDSGSWPMAGGSAPGAGEGIAGEAWSWPGIGGATGITGALPGAGGGATAGADVAGAVASCAGSGWPRPMNSRDVKKEAKTATRDMRAKGGYGKRGSSTSLSWASWI